MNTEYGFATREELDNTEKRLSKDIRENRKIINDNSRDIARLSTLYQSLEGLPDAIVGLDKTLIRMGDNMDTMNEKITGVSSSIKALQEEAEKNGERIEAIDNKSKIDWQTSITHNFWKIAAIAFGAYTVVELAIKILGGG